MLYLLVAEKGSAARKIRDSLMDNSRTERVGKVEYYVGARGSDELVVVQLAGYVFRLDYPAERTRRWEYPDFLPPERLELVPDRSDYIQAVRAALAKHPPDVCVLATDLDIEGSNLGAQVLHKLCGLPADYRPTGREGCQFRRLAFSALTNEELQRAWASLQPLDTARAQSGMCRSILDLQIGANQTRALTRAARAGGLDVKVLSSGRCQATLLTALYNREQEIANFKPEQFFEIVGVFEGGRGGRFEAAYIDPQKTEHKERIPSKERADRVVAECKAAGSGDLTVARKTEHEAPPPPFDLGRLQSTAYSWYGIPPAKTQGAANELYHLSLISYPRTSGNRLKEGYRKREYILPIFERLRGYAPLADAAAYVTANLRWPPREGSHEDPAHPCLHPVAAPSAPLAGAQQRVFELISRRFLSSFAPDAIVARTAFQVSVGPHQFVAHGSQVLEPGYRRVYPVRSEEKVLPPLDTGERVRLVDIRCEQKETQPPKRYNESSLIRWAEANRVGTKSTRAAIIGTLLGRGYVENPRQMRVTPLGSAVARTLLANVPKLTTPALTSSIEGELDAIEAGRQDYAAVISKYLGEFEAVMTEFKAKERDIGAEIARGVGAVVKTCPKCGSALVERRSQYGPFLGCSSFPRCRYTERLPKASEARAAVPAARPRTAAARATKVCPDCGARMVKRRSQYGLFWGCSSYPLCRRTERITGKAKKQRTPKSLYTGSHN